MKTQNDLNRSRQGVRFIGLLTLLLTTAALGQDAQKKYSGKIICGSFSADPKKYPAWNDQLEISINRRTLVATPSRSQGQILAGMIAPSGAILMTGEGGAPGQPPEWTYEFSGQLNPKGPTVLRGQLANIVGGGAVRSCAISF